MRSFKFALAIASCVLLLGVCAVAGQNSMGVSDRYHVTFSEKVRVADTLLPSGDYEIRHVMEGPNHIMVFRQLGVSNPIQVRAKCTLVALSGKALESQKVYALNSANERILKELTFRGDRASHVF
jgi:hypothetical protein